MAFFTSQMTTDAPHTAARAGAKTKLPHMPSHPAKLTPHIDCDVMADDLIAEYRMVAEQVGISPADIVVEEFRAFLAKSDIPIFSLAEVITYMDDIAAKDNPTRLGWHWCPVRDRDAEVPMTFGRPSEKAWNTSDKAIPASDFYESHRFRDHQRSQGFAIGTLTVTGGGEGAVVSSLGQQALAMQNAAAIQNTAAMQQVGLQVVSVQSAIQPPAPLDWRAAMSPAYTRTIPLHALRKIALIEKHFGGAKPVFLVSDYTVTPHVQVNPDPFLMAVIPNSAVAFGKGRFVIDVWDEPGFGIDRMLK